MLIFERIAEQRIAEAVERGDFDDLPGAGQPLALDDDALVPEELRMAYRILKNAGFVPPEVETLREIGDLERAIDALPAGEGRDRALRKLQLLRVRLETSGRGRGLGAGAAYANRVLERLADPR